MEATIEIANVSSIYHTGKAIHINQPNFVSKRENNPVYLRLQGTQRGLRELMNTSRWSHKISQF